MLKMDDLDALLADLQNTISPVTQTKQNHPQTVNGANSYPNNNSTYGSIKKPSVNFDESQIEKSRPPNDPSQYLPKQQQFQQQHSPTYQNSSVMQNTSLDDSLLELDTLLDDLGSAVTHPSNKNAISANHFGSAIENHINHVLGDISNSVNGNNSKQLMYVKKETKTEKTLQGHPSEMAHSTESYVSTNNNQFDSVTSSASKELDALMASLSDVKIDGNDNWQNQQQITDSVVSYAQSKPKQATQSKNLTSSDDFEEDNYLDSMLGNLKADMSRQGVNTAQKGCCSACDKPIVGQVITALGKTWHPEHFTCTHCTEELGTKNFFERDGQPYCETDYHNLFSPRCAYCNGPILDKCVTALEKTWHTEHFFCAQCGKQFGEEGFHEKNGKPYCRDDYFDMFAPKCKACNRAITENYISALNGQWHANCFVCRDCHLPFLGGSFFDHEGQPYCETHYHTQRGSLCGGCHKPITGRCVTAMFRKFHPEHFVCAFCLKQLNKGTFKEHNDKPYCHVCFDKLFG